MTAAMRDEFEAFGSHAFDLASAHHWDNPENSEIRQNIRQRQRDGAGEPMSANQASATPGAVHSEDHVELQRPWSDAGYLKDNPFGVPTEREVQTTKQNGPVYRVLLIRRC